MQTQPALGVTLNDIGVAAELMSAEHETMALDKYREPGDITTRLPRKVLSMSQQAGEMYYLCSWHQENDSDTHYEPTWVSSYTLSSVLKEHRLIVEFYERYLPGAWTRQMKHDLP